MIARISCCPFMSRCKCICGGGFTAWLGESECTPVGGPDKFSVVRSVDRVWFSLACLPC